ncbi:hypothetical protein Tco_1533388 [Tanacetum coccineum]
MAALESCPKHNMIAYLEKTEGNVEFHEVIDFLRRSYIYHALTVSPVVSTTFVEQFWTSAKSKTINNVRHITAKIAGKSVSISEASIRTDLIFDDADGIDSLPNQAIFNAIQLMGYEGDLTNLGDHSSNDASLSRNEDDMTLQNVYDLCISYFNRISGRLSHKTKIPKEKYTLLPMCHKKNVSKQGRKKAKGESEVHRHPLFDEMPEDKIDQMETEDALKSEGGQLEKWDEDWLGKFKKILEAEEERIKIAEEKATNEALIKNFDDIKTRIEADRILAEKLQEAKKESIHNRRIAKFPS